MQAGASFLCPGGDPRSGRAQDGETRGRDDGAEARLQGPALLSGYEASIEVGVTLDDQEVVATVAQAGEERVALHVEAKHAAIDRARVADMVSKARAKG